MFPVIQISISGLDPDAKYIVVMDIVPVDDNRLMANAFVQEFCLVWFSLLCVMQYYSTKLLVFLSLTKV